MASNKTSVIKRKFQLSCAAKRGSVSRGIHNREGGKWGPSSRGTVNSTSTSNLSSVREEREKKRGRESNGKRKSEREKEYIY